MKKQTPKELVAFRRRPLVIKWRASGKNGTVTRNPLLSDRIFLAEYQKTCNDYVKFMVSSIIATERRLFIHPLQLRSPEYYYKRYDVTAVECTILREEILNQLN